MTKGTKVSWQIAFQDSQTAPSFTSRGNGVTVSDQDENGEILVKVNTFAGEPNPGYHLVICCTVTWLTVEL